MSLKDIYPFSILVITPDSLEPGEDYEFLFQHVGVMLWDPSETAGSVPGPWVDIRLSRNPSAMELSLACTHMSRLLELKEQALKLHNTNAITETRNRQLNQVGIALMSEKNLDQLLNMILEKAMELTGSDAGCLYLVERKDNAEEIEGELLGRQAHPLQADPQRLRGFQFRGNDHAAYQVVHQRIRHDGRQAAQHPRCLFHSGNGGIPAQQRIRPLLRVPHPFHADLAHERPPQPRGGGHPAHQQMPQQNRSHHLPEGGGCPGGPYRQEDLNISLSLASQASVALLNAQYELDIQRLFEGFINASVTAIESRDPTTSGHSHRVAEYCVRLSDCLARTGTGKYAMVRLNDTQVRELRYAALLHDFGKIGVREHILTKSKKLFPEEMENIRMRSEFIKRTMNWESEKAKVAMLRAGSEPDPEAALRRLEEEEARNLESVDRVLRDHPECE